MAAAAESDEMKRLRDWRDPADGCLLWQPSTEMVASCYYLTQRFDSPSASALRTSFSSLDDALMAFDSGLVGIHSWIDARTSGTEFTFDRRTEMWVSRPI